MDLWPWETEPPRQERKINPSEFMVLYRLYDTERGIPLKELIQRLKLDISVPRFYQLKRRYEGWARTGRRPREIHVDFDEIDEEV